MSDNRNPHKLDAGENERIFREEILPEKLKNNPALRPIDTPTMLVVGGQPGAGKTNSIKSIEAEFAGRGGVLVVDLDALRENHSEYRQLMRADDKAAAQHTYDDARVWAQKLEDYAKANRYNVLVESLMTSPDGVDGWLQDYRDAGYRTEAHVVAVNERSSVQGIVQRYEREKFKSEDNVGRTVPRDVHNLAYDRVRDTFDRIETDKLSDRVVVHNRNGEVVYDNRLQSNGQWAHAPGSARTAIETERGRSLSPTQWRDHILTYDDIQANQRRPERGAAQAELDEVRQLRTASVREGGLTAQAGLHPVLSRTAIGAGVLATAYDAAVSGRDAWELHQQGNAVGAESKVMQFGARNAGAWAGALMGAKAGTLAGVESGPGMLVTGIVGAGIGAWGAERVVDWIEQNKINTQTDRSGAQWRFDPENAEKGWQRDVVDAFAERGLSLKHKETAPPDIADGLNFKASTMAVQLRLSSPDISVNPFEIAADANDTRSLRESPWIRNAGTKEWHREVADGMIDRTMHTYTEKAIGEKSAELDAYAQSVIVYNAARSPAAVAAHFEDVYRDNGWARHGDGQLPPAVRHAREDLETLVASDGDRYRRQQNGEWISDGLIHDSTAQGNLRDELNATHTALQTRWMPAPLSPSAQESAIGIEPRALDPASEQQRDVHEQAQREANREGLSLDESRLAIAAPVRMATAGRREDGSHESDAPHDDRRQERAVNGADSMAMAASTPPLPVRLPDPRDADHPGHPLYKQIERGVAGVDALHPGDRGPEVWTLQDNLIRSGVNERLPNPVQAHGAYDQATQRGVMAFQLQQGLEPTGIADAITREVVQQRMVAHVQTSPSLTPTHATYAPLAQQTPVTTPPAPEAPTAGVDAHWQQQRVREQQARMRAQTRHEEEAKRREEEPTRQTFDPLAAASSQTSKPARIEDHPALPGIRQALCDKLEQQGQLAGVSDDRLTEIAGQLHRKGLRADGRWAASIRNDTFFAQDQELARCGFRMKLDLLQPPPSPEQTLQEVATFDRQQTLDAQAIAEQRQREQDDPNRGGPTR